MASTGFLLPQPAPRLGSLRKSEAPTWVPFLFTRLDTSSRSKMQHSEDPGFISRGTKLWRQLRCAVASRYRSVSTM